MPRLLVYSAAQNPRNQRLAAGTYLAAPQLEFLLAMSVVPSAIVNSLRMEARHHKHRNKHKRRSCQRKVCGFRYEIRKHIVYCHHLLLPIHSIIIERIVYGALAKNLRMLRAISSVQSSKAVPPQIVIVGAGFGDYCLRSAVLGGARIRPAHAAARSESG